MRQGNPLIIGKEMDRVVPGHATAAQGRKTDVACLACASDPVPAPCGMAGEVNPAPGRRRLAQQQRRAGRRVDLQAVMRLDHFDVPILAQAARSFAHQVRQ